MTTSSIGLGVVIRSLPRHMAFIFLWRPFWQGSFVIEWDSHIIKLRGSPWMICWLPPLPKLMSFTSLAFFFLSFHPSSIQPITLGKPTPKALQQRIFFNYGTAHVLFSNMSSDVTHSLSGNLIVSLMRSAVFLYGFSLADVSVYRNVTTSGHRSHSILSVRSRMIFSRVQRDTVDANGTRQ